MSANTPDLGYVRLISDEPKRNISFRMGENPPTPVSQYAKWALITRPRKVDMTDWQGREPLAIRIELMADAWESTDADLEPKRHALEIMAGLDDDPTEPPMIEWYANSPHDNDDIKGRLWYIEDVQWGIFRKRGSELKRFTATITLRHFVPDEYLERNGAKKNKNKKKKKKKENARGKKKKLVGKVIKIQAGMNLGKVAAIHLGHHSRWVEIAELNGIRDPENVTEGQEILLP